MLLNMRISVRLAVVFSLLLVLLCAVAGLGMNSMAGMQQRVDRLVGKNSAQISHAKTMGDGFRDILLSVSIMVQVEDKAALADHKAKLTAARAKYGKARKAYVDNDLDDQEQALLARLDAALTTVIPLTNKVVALAEEGNRDQAAGLMLKQSEPAGRAAIAIIDEIVDHEEATAKDAAAASKAGYERSRALVLALSALAILFGAVAAWLITRSITQPMRQAVSAAERVASGDLSGTIEIRAGDETGRLLRALRDMNGSLGEVVGQVRAGTDAIATASGQIADGNQDLSQRTE